MQCGVREKFIATETTSTTALECVVKMIHRKGKLTLYLWHRKASSDYRRLNIWPIQSPGKFCTSVIVVVRVCKRQQEVRFHKEKGVNTNDNSRVQYSAVFDSRPIWLENSWWLVDCCFWDPDERISWEVCLCNQTSNESEDIAISSNRIESNRQQTPNKNKLLSLSLSLQWRRTVRAYTPKRPKAASPRSWPAPR